MPQRSAFEVEAHSDRVIARRLTTAYVFGLLLIGLLTAGVHGLLDHIVAQQRDAATIINVAGRQRMLSQRIALLSGALAEGDESARAPLHLAILQMERGLDALVNGGDLGISRPLSPALHDYFFVGPNALEPAVRAYLQDSKTFLDTGAPGLLVRIRLAARQDLILALDHSVALFETEANRQVDQLRLMQTGLLTILLVALLLEATFIFRPLVSKIGQTTTRLLDLATHDGLTGFLNHRFFIETAGRILEAGQTAPLPSPISVLMLDLDHFKRVNDGFGHATGDLVLARVARAIRDTLRASDVCARMGGEEFAILLPATDADSAVTVAEKLRAAIAADRSGPGPIITVSIGVSGLGGPSDSLDHMLDRADRALYRAKSAGRDCVRLACTVDPRCTGTPACECTPSGEGPPEVAPASLTLLR